AWTGRDPDQASEAAVCTRRSAAFRTRQMVSRRIAAALVARLLVAARRRADLERRLAHRRRDSRLRARRGAGEARHHGARRRAGGRFAACHPRVRRRLALSLAGTAVAGERGPAEVRAEGRRRARTALADPRAGAPRPSRRVRVAVAPDPQTQPGHVLGERRLVPALRAPVPDSGRFARRLSVA